MDVRKSGLVIIVISAVLYAMNFMSPNDLLFLFISNNVFIGLARIFICLVILAAGWRGYFSYKTTSKSLKVIGSALLLLGIAGISVSGIDYRLINILKPMDYLFAAEMGLLYWQSALTYRYNWRRKPLLTKIGPKLRPRVQLQQPRRIIVTD